MSIQENLLMGACTSNDKGQIQADIDRWFEVFPRLKERAAQGITILLVEQNAKLALQAAHRGYVMELGLITMEGQAQQMLDDPRVKAAYLGE